MQGISNTGKKEFNVTNVKYPFQREGFYRKEDILFKRRKGVGEKIQFKEGISQQLLRRK